MGRALLIALAAASLAACVVDETTSSQTALAEAAAVATDPHAELPCAACHTGGLTYGRRAAVPKASCATSGCHQEGGPPVVSTATATFNHRDHGQDGEIAMACAGCHTHDDGAQPLRVSSDGCALCHLTDLKSSQPDDCRLCHQQPKHVAMSSQALPIPHSALPWVETGCVRCHYDVAEPATRVTLGRCTDCHVNDSTVIAKGIGSDLHPAHTALTCTACHESGAHHVRAMSSAVQLACADCHVSEHGVALPAQWQDDGVCGDCHTTVHQAQQRLLLGVLPDGGSAPSSKFIAGITCRSCHLRNERTVASGNAIRGQAEACAGCHQGEYRNVLRWWLDGSRARTTAVTAYVRRAQADLTSANDSVQALLSTASAMVGLVEAAGGQHNLELSDRIFRESVARVQRAYAMARRAPAPAPELGSPAHEGVCSFCHYGANEAWDFRNMPEAFHRSLPSAVR